MAPHPTRLLPAALLLLGLMPCAADAQWRTNGAPICTTASNQFTPLGVADGAGGALFAWYDYRAGNSDIYVHHVLASGAADPAWPANGRGLCTAPGGQYSPVIVPDGTGGAIVAWHDDRTSNTDIYAQHVTASGVADPAWPANGRGLCTASGDQVYPAIAPDGAGGALAAWRDYRGGPDTDIYAQHVLASGALDPAWPANGRAVCTAGGNQSNPVLVSDGAGGAFLAWSDLRGAHSDIYVQHVLAGGAVDPAWPADGRALCVATGNQSGVSIVSDGAGGAIVSWFDYRNGLDADIYAQRVLGTGVADPAWPGNGRALCMAVGEQYSPVMAPDGAGGAIAVWYDYRDDPKAADVYAHHVLASGAADPAWPANGRAMCATAGDQHTPAIAADGAGGALAAWFDYRAGNSDVFAQHASAPGPPNAGWPEDGRAVCTIAGEQWSPSLVADGAGGAILAWTDFRAGTYSDIYVQRVRADGKTTAVERERGAPLGLHPIRPNPARARATLPLELAEPRRITVDVLEASGRRVRTLLAGRELPAGAHLLTWDGADDAGAPRASGVYWIRVRGAGPASARKVALVR